MRQSIVSIICKEQAIIEERERLLLERNDKIKNKKQMTEREGRRNS